MGSRNCCIYLNLYLGSSYTSCGETYLGTCQTSMMELFSEKRELLLAVHHLLKKLHHRRLTGC